MVHVKRSLPWNMALQVYIRINALDWRRTKKAHFLFNKFPSKLALPQMRNKNLTYMLK